MKKAFKIRKIANGIIVQEIPFDDEQQKYWKEKEEVHYESSTEFVQIKMDEGIANNASSKNKEFRIEIK